LTKLLSKIGTVYIIEVTYFRVSLDSNKHQNKSKTGQTERYKHARLMNLNIHNIHHDSRDTVSERILHCTML